MSANAVRLPELTSSESLNHDAMPLDWLPELPSVDLSWVANTSSYYVAALKKLPQVFAWDEVPEYFAVITTLLHSVTSRRLRSCFDFVGRFDPALRRSMQLLFQKLPKESQLRFTTAPETFYRISRMRREPVESVVALCNMLNGEAASRGLGPVKEGYVSALGDYFAIAESELKPTLNAAWDDDAGLYIVRAPLVGSGIPVDFSSPLMENAQEMKAKKIYGKYSLEQQSQICEQLERTIGLIERTSSAAAALIKTFVRVIVPLNSVSGYGSTSQPRIPGRVLLSGIERSSDAALASALVHEAMHQLMYILEWSGTFITPDEDADSARVTSLWTGRELPLHSFIHACFIWYGVSNFWFKAKPTKLFDSTYLDQELQRCTSGFLERNPVDMLEPHATKVRYDVYKVASTLRDNIMQRFAPHSSDAIPVAAENGYAA